MANTINAVLTYNANLSPAQAQIKALTGQIAGLTAAFNALDKSALKAQAALATTFMSNVGQIGGFTTQMVKSTTAVDNFGNSIAKQRLTMRQYFREAIAGYTRQNSLMKQLAVQQVRMQQSMVVPMGAGMGGGSAVLTPTSIASMGNAASIASQKFSIFNELVKGGSTRLLNFGKNTQWTGRQLMVGFTLPLVMFTALVSKQFRDIDKELTRFEKVYGADLVNSVGVSTEKMRESVKQLAFDMGAAYGIAAKETAALAADIAATGKEGDDLLASVRQTTRLSVLGEVERTEAMRATLSIQNAFKLSTDELTESIDFLNAVENQTSTNLQDLAGAIPRVGPVIQALGGDIKDMSLLLVAMKEGGVAAGEGANALKSGLGRLINPTRAARDMAASFGISLQSIIDSSQGELLPMIFGLQDALNGLDDFSKAQVLEKVFGKYQFARMSALFANLRRQGSQTLSVMELAGASSTELAKIANEELRTLQESTSMRFQRTIEQLRNSIVPLGEVLTETLIPILSGIGGGIKSFLEFFQSLPEPVKNFTKYAVALTALAGPVVMLVGLFGNLIANGIKFTMSIVRLGAKVGGLRFEKFQLLTADTMAAGVGVDKLTSSFVTQEAALKRLVGVMATYSASLGRLATGNPGMLIPAAGLRATPVIRRQKGSTSPETVPGGYGGGDVVPALLEPGEFVVRKEAASKNKDFLRALNRGMVRGYAFGDEVAPAPGTGDGRSKAPPQIREALIHKAQQIRMQEVIDEIARRAGITFDSDAQKNQATKIHLSHYEKDLRMHRGSMVKFFDPASLLLASGAENQGFEQLTGKDSRGREKVARKEIIRLIDQFASDDLKQQMYVRDSNGKITDIRHPKTREQMALFSRIIGQMLETPDNKAIWGKSTKVKAVWAPLFKAILDERLTGGGRLLPPEIPMARATARAIMAASPTGDPLLRGMAARRSVSGSPTAPVSATSVPPAMRRPVGPGPRPPIQPILPGGRFGFPLRVQPGEMFVPARYADTLSQMGRDGVVRPIPPSDPRSDLMQRLAARGGRTAGPRVTLSVTGQTQGITPSAPNSLALKAATTGPRTPASPMSTGPSANLSESRMKTPGMMPGMGLMNIAFASSMIVSSMSMAGGASNDLAIKMGLLSGAVMTAAAMMQMFAGKNVMGNFLGLGSAGSKMTGAGVAAQRGAIATHGSAAAARAAGAGGAGANLLRGGAMLSMMGGPIGMAVGGVAVAGIAGFIAYQKAAEQSRERAMAAFADPAKTAEYFGVTVSDITEKLKAVSAAVEGTEDIDQNLREAVKQDYAPLIEKIKYGGAEAGGRELGLVFNKMLASGLSAEQAKESVKAIAIEAGTAGGQSYAEAMRKGFLSEKTGAEIARETAKMFDPEQQLASMASAQKTLDGMVVAAGGSVGRFTGALALATDNWIGTVGVNIVGLGAGITGLDFDTVERRQDISEGAAQERQIHQMQTGIEEMADVSGDSLVKITEVLFENFKLAPRETVEAFDDIAEAGKKSTAIAFDTGPIKEFISEIDPLNGIILNAIIGQDEDIAMAVSKAIGAGMSVSEIIEALNRGGIPALEVDVEFNVKRQELQIELDELTAQLKEDLVIDLDIEIKGEEDKLDKVNNKLERMDLLRQRYEGTLKKAMNSLNRESERSIEGMESEIELIQERAELRREEFDEKIENLNEEKDLINKSSEAYIKSLQKRQRADSFYSNQRKTAFSALEKLAAGDVFGFLQDRGQMSEDAQNFSYENTISDIEEKRDREIETIDEVIEKEQEKQEKYEKNAEDRIDLINDQIDSERDLMDERQKNFERDMRFFDRKERRRRIDLENEKKELLVSLDNLRSVRKGAEDGVLQDQATLSKALGEAKAAPYFEQQKAIVKTAMMEKYMEMKQKYPDEKPETLEQRAYGELIDLFSALYGATAGQRRLMDYKGQLADIGFARDAATTPSHLARGGKVKGPGTATSDSIPARLSDGEYVVRASSVKKYGTGLMHSINEGKFAYGGYVGSIDAQETRAQGNVYGGIPKPKPTTTYYGGTPTSTTTPRVIPWNTSADQAERNAQAAAAAAKKKQKTVYSGGTPTSSTGYSTANTQATKTSGYKSKISKQPKIKTGGGFLGDMLFEGLRLDFADFINTTLLQGQSSDLENLVGMNVSGDRFYGQRSETDKAIGNALFGSNFVPLPFIGPAVKMLSSFGKMLPGKTGATSTVLNTPPPGSNLGDLFSLGMGVDRSAVAAAPVEPRAAAVPASDMLRFGRVEGRHVDENQLDNVFGTLVPDSQGGISPGGLVVGMDGIRRYVKGPYDSQSGPKSVYLESLIANAYKALNMNVPDVSLLNIGAKERYFPGKPLPPALAAQRPNYYPPGELITSSTMLDNVKHVSEFFGKKPDRDWADGLTFAESQLDKGMQATLAKEGGIGKAVDTLFGLRDTHILNYIIKENESIPLGVPGRLNPYRIDFGSNVFQTPGGRPVRYDPSDPLKIIDPEYGSSFGFGKVNNSVYKQQVLRLEQMLGDTGGMGGLIDPIVGKFALQAPQHKLVNPDYLKFVLAERLRAMVEGVRGYAQGGLVESMEKYFPNGKHSFYPGWNKYSSWAKGKPQLVTMHHTALPPGVSQQAELDSFAKEWERRPVVQSWIGKSGMSHTLAAGNTGFGHGDGTTKYMKGETEQAKEIIDIVGHPNSTSWQMEVSSAGKTQDFTSGQFDAIARTTAAIRDWAGWPGFEGRIINHKDWGGYRTDGTAKNDTLYPISTFVKNAEKVWGEGGGGKGGGGKGGKGDKDTPVGDRTKPRAFIQDLPRTPSLPGIKFGKAEARDLGRLILPTKNDTSPETSGGGRGGITLDPKDYQDGVIDGYKLVKLIYGTGWKSKDDVRTGYGIVMGESGGDRKGENYNAGGVAPGSTDLGLWQINDFFHKTAGDDKEKVDFGPKIFDAIYNSRIAYKIAKSKESAAAFNGDQWGSWNAHKDQTQQYRLGLQAFDNNPNWWRQVSTEAGGSTTGNGGSGNNGGGSISNSVISYARDQLGKPYVIPANPPSSWDCSTLTAAAWNQAAGKNVLGSYSHTQANQLMKRSVGLKSGKISGLSIGDVLYFNGIDSESGGHVSLYAGNEKVIEASSPSTGVRTSALNNGWNEKYFKFGGPPKGYKGGGSVFGQGGPTSDSIPAMLSNGEYVIKAGSVNKYGKGFLDKINSGQLGSTSMVTPGFANGGMVSPSYNIPVNNMLSSSDLQNNINNLAVQGNSSSSSSNNIKIVINGSGGNAKAVANQVVKMINNSTDRRDHARSIS